MKLQINSAEILFLVREYMLDVMTRSFTIVNRTRSRGGEGNMQHTIIDLRKKEKHASLM